MDKEEDKESVDSFEIDPWDSEPGVTKIQIVTETRVKSEMCDSQSFTNDLLERTISPSSSIAAKRGSVPVVDYDADMVNCSSSKRPCIRSLQQVKTFVFLDLETTGILKQLANDNAFQTMTERSQATARMERIIKELPTNAYTHITDIALVAVDREIFVSSMNLMNTNDYTMHKNGEDKSRKTGLPCSVHSRLIKPSLNDFEWADLDKKCRELPSVFRTGRFELSKQRTFREEWLGVRLFLESLPKPACLVAHNGIRFDFPVLYGELLRNHIVANALPAEVYFIDSWMAFRDLDDAAFNKLGSVTSEMDWKTIFEQTANNTPKTVQATNAASLQRAKTNPRKNDERDLFDDSQIITGSRISANVMIRTPERPIPTRGSASEPSKLDVRRILFSPRKHKNQQSHPGDMDTVQLPNDHPLLYMNSETWSPAKRNYDLQKFFIKTREGKWEFDKNAAISHCQNKGNYKLENLYKRNIQDIYDAHSAEPDCHALAQVCLAYGEDFVKYVDKMAANFPF